MVGTDGDDARRHELSQQAVEALRHLTEEYAWPLADGEVRFVKAVLPDHVVVGIARQDAGPVWVITASNWPNTQQHLRELLEHWPEGLDEAMAHLPLQRGREPLPFDDDEDEGYEPDDD